MDDVDILEWIKVVVALTLGYIIIKALLFGEPQECLCKCVNDSVIHLR